MIEPKVFYRKLDIIQNKIGKDRSGKDFLFYIVSELESVFGEDLHIGRGFIYEKNDEEYVIISELEEEELNINESFSVEDVAVKVLQENKIYIFDNENLLFPGWERGLNKNNIAAAIRVSSFENSWIFLFELTDGWEREEIEFCFNAVRTALKYRLVSDSLNNEVQQAVHIQKSLLPSHAPNKDGYDIAGLSIPAELVGGDIYDYFEYEDNSFGFCIGDASGHGLPAALLARDAITGLRMGMEKQMKMVHTLKRLNKVIYRSVFSTRFISLFYGELEDDGNLFYVNAGHPQPILFSQNDVKELRTTGLVFGALPEIELNRSFAKIDVGSILLLYSDGITESANIIGEQYGTERMKKIVLANREKNAEELIQVILEDAKSFSNTKTFDDDVTLLILKRES